MLIWLGLVLLQIDAEPMCRAVNSGNLSLVQKELVKEPRLLFHYDQHDQGWLHHAVEAGHPDLVRFFVEKGHQPDDRGRSNLTALHLVGVPVQLARSEKNTAHATQLLSALFKAKPDTELRDNLGRTAFQNGGPPPAQASLETLARYIRLMQMFHQNGADLCAPYRSKAQGHGSLLEAAAAAGHPQLVAFFLKADAGKYRALYSKALFATLTSTYPSALPRQAWQERMSDCVRLLVTAGAPLDQPDAKGVLPLDHAKKVLDAGSVAWLKTFAAQTLKP